jgi:hypothetical protein
MAAAGQHNLRTAANMSATSSAGENLIVPAHLGDQRLQQKQEKLERIAKRIDQSLEWIA